jgi:IS605 OrfB family transposase
VLIYDTVLCQQTIVYKRTIVWYNYSISEGGEKSMKLSQKVYVSLSHKQKRIFDELTWHATKLYNISNYEFRENEYISYGKNDKICKLNWHSDYLHAHNRQQILRKLDKDWKSFFKAIEGFRKNPKKYTGRPKKPGFKNLDTRLGEVIFTKPGITQTHTKKNNPEGNLLILSLVKKMQSKYQVKNIKLKLTEKVLRLIGDLKNINQVIIKKDYYSGQYYLNVVYTKKENKKEVENYTNIMSIDLGLDNLATLAFLENKETYIIDGKVVKSRRKYFDKEISYLQSIRMKQTGSKYFTDTKKIKSLRKNNKDYQLNYLHHAAKDIIELAKKHEVRSIVVGDMRNIKKGMKNNKSFVRGPIQKLKKLIEYKALLEGINYIEQNEAYTSGCSALDLESIDKKSYNKKRRITRGLFRSNKDYLINADVNGSLNILRKYLKLKCIPKLILSAMDNGVVDAPKRISVAC